ncbi:MAG TPA: zinc-ribbon domain-containing protein [Candidatus Methanomethylophilaceae archaeon]|nr:zinc-ribbon domain-containing protein [Candidatus Methanomethylophilaceae archaeon]
MIIYICSECGHEIPQDSDFCYKCGSLRSKALKFDTGEKVQREEVQYPCPSCGKPNDQGAKFCKHCGIEVDSIESPEPTASQYQSGASSTSYQVGRYGSPYGHSPAPVLRKNGGLAMALGFLFGFAGIYGMGHFVLRRWSRGLMYLAISAVNWYIYISVSGYPQLIIIASLLIFFKQSMEITNLAYGRE